MRKIVYMYLGKGIAEADNEAGYGAGEKHAMLVFLASFADNYDWKEAERVAREKGWREIEFSKAGKVTREMVLHQDANVKACFEQALAGGSAMLVYAGLEK